MRVILFGATGMVGKGVLIECLEDPRVVAVLVVGRQPCDVTHAKLRQMIRSDFFHWDDAREDLKSYDACFFCLGVSSVGMDVSMYFHLTYDLTTAVAEALASVSPGITFCYVSGEGTDSTERGRSMWARVKGRTENELLRLLPNAFAFRPGYIQPMKGARSKTGWYQLMYNLLAPLYPALRLLAGSHMTTTENVGRAMIAVAANGYRVRMLENVDINVLASRGRE
jgi:uncharacterized protein YbjT (DUF2867 family)